MHKQPNSSGGGSGSGSNNRADGLYAVLDGHGGPRAAEFGAQVRSVCVCMYTCRARPACSFVCGSCLILSIQNPTHTGAHPPHPPAARGHRLQRIIRTIHSHQRRRQRRCVCASTRLHMHKGMLVPLRPTRSTPTPTPITHIQRRSASGWCGRSRRRSSRRTRTSWPSSTPTSRWCVRACVCCGMFNVDVEPHHHTNNPFAPPHQTGGGPRVLERGHLRGAGAGARGRPLRGARRGLPRRAGTQVGGCVYAWDGCVSPHPFD